MHLFLGQVRCVSCSTTLTTCKEFRTLAPLQTYCTNEIESRGRSRDKGKVTDKSVNKGRSKARGKGRGRNTSKRCSKGRGRGKGGNEWETPPQLAGTCVNFKEEHGRLGWTMDPVDVLAFYTRRWLVLRREHPSSPSLLHEMAKLLQIYSPIEAIPPWQPAIARCWQYVTKMSKFPLTRSLRAPLETSKNRQWETAYSKRLKMSIKEANIRVLDSRKELNRKRDSLPEKNYHKRKFQKYSSSNVCSLDQFCEESDENKNISPNKKRKTKNNAFCEENLSNGKTSLPVCYVVEKTKVESKRTNGDKSEMEKKRSKRSQNMAADVCVAEKDENYLQEELQDKIKVTPATRKAVHGDEMKINEHDFFIGKNNLFTADNNNPCESSDELLLKHSEDLKLSPSQYSFSVSNSQAKPNTSSLSSEKELTGTQDIEVSVISSKTLQVPDFVISSDDLLDQEPVIFSNSCSECEFKCLDVDEVELKENIKSLESNDLDNTEMVSTEENTTASEFGDLLLPRVFSDSHLDEVVEVVSLVGCNVDWEAEARFTATKLVHVCWEGLDHHVPSRELGSVKS